ncbi:MAG: hypothetical protein WBX11_04920 [Thiobacillaceae bacterium]
MPYLYFDWGHCPARVLFENERPVKCEIWDPVNSTLYEDMRFLEGLGIDPERGLLHDEYVVSEEAFNALLQQRLSERDTPPVRIGSKPDDTK